MGSQSGQGSHIDDDAEVAPTLAALIVRMGMKDAEV